MSLDATVTKLFLAIASNLFKVASAPARSLVSNTNAPPKPMLAKSPWLAGIAAKANSPSIQPKTSLSKLRL